MKPYLTLIFLCVTFACFGQQDGQWYLTENFQVNSNTRSSNIQNFILEGVNHPDGNGDMNGDTARNDVFIIYSDGSYYNSRTTPFMYSDWNDTIPSSDYFFDVNSFNSNISINYMYFTNVYEGKDPPPMIINLNPTDPNPTNIPIFPTSTSGSDFESNHDAVENTDITLVMINPREDKGSTCSYKVCFHTTSEAATQVPETTNTTAVPPIALQESPIFAGNQFVLYGQNAHLIDSCIIYQPDLSKDYSYINLRVPDNLTTGNKNSVINFTFTPQEGCSNFGQIYNPITESVNLAHDPNFVQVSVYTDNNGQNFAKYHVQCYNDKPNANVKELRFTLLMPDHLDLTNHVITKSYLGMRPRNTSSRKVRLRNSPPNNNFLEFKFKPTLPNPHLDEFDANNINRSTGWVEFILPLHDSFDLAHVDLKPIYAKSYFDTLMFNIVEYRDACRTVTSPKKKQGFLSSCFSSCFCGERDSRVSNMDKWSIENGNIDDCCRISSGQCLNNADIQKGESHIICWLVFGLIALMFIFFILWLQRLFWKR